MLNVVIDDTMVKKRDAGSSLMEKNLEGKQILNMFTGRVLQEHVIGGSKPTWGTLELVIFALRNEAGVSSVKAGTGESFQREKCEERS